MVGLVGNFSVGIGPIGLKFGRDARNEVPHVGKSESNCYSMFRAKSVGLVGNSSVGIGPIGLKFNGDARSEVPPQGKVRVQLLLCVQGQVGGHGGQLLCGHWSHWAEIWCRHWK